MWTLDESFKLFFNIYSSGTNHPEESSIIDEAPLYNIEDEISEGRDNDDSDVDNHYPQKPSPFSALIRLMINPTDGWKKLRRYHFTPEQMGARCFYPLSALAALSAFADLFYNSDSTVSGVIVNALVTFISFFFGFFLLSPLGKIFLPKEVKEYSETVQGKVFNMAMLSTLAMFWILFKCLPMLDTIWVFLPLWTVFLISKGSRFIKASQQKPTTVTFILCVLIVGTPLAVGRIFAMILPY